MKNDTRPEGVPDDWTDDDWNTPPEIVARILRIDGIGFDPCSNMTSMVSARLEYMKPPYTRIDSLLVPWDGYGLVFVNPPYSRPLFSQFTYKIKEELTSNIELIALIPANVETAEWHDVYWNADAICFPRGRIRFWAAGKVQGTPRRPNAICYFGNRDKEFTKAFSDFGMIVKPINRGKLCNP